MASIANNMNNNNMPVTHGFTNPDHSPPLPGYHIIFNPTFTDFTFPFVINSLSFMRGQPFGNPPNLSSQGGRIHGADIWNQWLHNNGQINGQNTDYYDIDGGLIYATTGEIGPDNKCIANGSVDWAQWSKAINSIQLTRDNKGRNLCGEAMDTEAFFGHDDMRTKCQYIILCSGGPANSGFSPDGTDWTGKTLGFICITDLREVIQERLYDIDDNSDEPDVAHYHIDNDGDEVIHGEDYLYIDGLCSNVRGMGVQLMDKVIEMCFHNQALRGVKLSALPYVIKYYWNKYCFRFRPGDDICGPNCIKLSGRCQHLPQNYQSINNIVNALPTAPSGLDEDGRKFRTWTDETIAKSKEYLQLFREAAAMDKQMGEGTILPKGSPKMFFPKTGKRTLKPTQKMTFDEDGEQVMDKTDYAYQQEDFQEEVFGQSKDRLSALDRESLKMHRYADIDDTTPGGEGLYMYLCFSRQPNISITLQYPCRTPSSNTNLLLKNSQNQPDQMSLRHMRRVRAPKGGKNRRRKKTRKKKKKSLRSKKRKKKKTRKRK